MIVRLFIVVLGCMLLSAVAFGGELSIVEAATAKGVEKGGAIAPGSTFPADVGKVYLLNHIKGAMGEAAVKNIWYYKNTKVAEVSLKLKSDDWTTYSYVQIMPEQKGDWKVEIVDESGNVLKSLGFSVE